MNIIKNTNNIILTLLAVHLLYINSMLLNSLNDVHIAFIILFAGSYSVLTAIILNKIPSVILFTIAALLDGFGVYAEYSDNVSSEMVAIYFGIYTAMIVIAVGSLKKLTDNKQKENVELAVQKGKVKQHEKNIQQLTDEKQSLENNIQQLNVQKKELADNLRKVVEDYNVRLKQGAGRQPKNIKIIEENDNLLKTITT